MKALVIGMGSIGERHAAILKEIGYRVTVVSRREHAEYVRYPNIEEALLAGQYDYAVIANKTNEHESALQKLIRNGHRGKILVEKPLFSRNTNFELVGIDESKVKVAYNLRFHPIVRTLKRKLEHEKIISIQAYVGQYLPDWRPSEDYRNGYSANRDEGGGVLRDLSHELDFVTWIAGGWNRLAAIGGRIGNLDITSDDVYTVLLNAPGCPVVSIHMNYWDRPVRRFLHINTENATYRADLVNQTLATGSDVQNFTVDRNDTYRAMHRSFTEDDGAHCCTFQEGIRVMKLIEAIETADKKEAWVNAE